MLRKYVFLLNFLLLALFSCNKSSVEVQSSIKDITPKKDYAMLIVESESCIYCKQLNKDLESNQLLKEKTIQLDVFKIDVDSNGKVKHNFFGKTEITTEKNLAKTLGVNSFPHVVFYNSQGNIILSLPGYIPPKTLACVIDYVKKEEYQRTNLTTYLKNQEC